VCRSTLGLCLLMLCACTLEVPGSGPIQAAGPAPEGTHNGAAQSPGGTGGASGAGNPASIPGQPEERFDAGSTFLPGADAGAAGQIDASDPQGSGTGQPRPALILSSPAFGAGDRLPNAHSCVGGSVSPPLSWSGGPAATRSYAVALIARYPAWQAQPPTAAWVVWDIHAQELPAGIEAGEMPSNLSGARQTSSTSGVLPYLGAPPGYVAPCLLSGVESFEFVVYALSADMLPITTPVGPDTIVSELERNASLSLARSALPFTFP
jgi:phosphatidylethanolamine-binding protein (PEBP) family uncharacterized protein